MAGLNARVLIVARDDRLSGPLSDGLDRLGWRTVTARGLQTGLLALMDLDIEVAILDLGGLGAEAQAIAGRLKAEALPRRLPVLGLGRSPGYAPTADALDLALAEPLHPAQAALRLETLVRGAVSEEEFELRAATFAERGVRLTRPATDPAPLRVLTVGEPAPKFLALSHALRAGGAEVTGSFTPYTAFDYLHDSSFDAVVLWAGETHAEALSIAGGMRRNTRLYHIPTLLYLRSGAEVERAAAYDRGLSDVADAQTPAAEAAERVLALARAYRRDTAVRQALDVARGAGLTDPATGLFSREVFAAHLARLQAASQLRRRALSVAVLRIAEKAEVAELRARGWLDRAIPQIGSMIGRLVRAEDTAARLSSDVFALALPASTQGAAQAAAERIAAVIACTAFEAGPARPAFTVDFEIGAAQLLPGESAAHALERAAARTLSRRAG